MSDRWTAATLGQLLTLEYGKSLPANNRDGIGYPVYGSNGKVGLHSKPLVEGPGIIVGRKGTAGSVTWSDEAFFAIDTTYWVKLKHPEDLAIRFAYLLLLSADLAGICAQTGVPGLNRERAYQVKVSLPPLEVQRRIVDLIGAIDAHIANLDGELEGLQVVRARALSALLSREVELPDAYDRLLDAGVA